MLTGVILAGGQNRRMNGKIKAFLPFGGSSILERQMLEMKKICREIIIVARQMKSFKHLKTEDTVRVIEDDVPGKGPLSGMHAAASRATEKQIWLIACDMPYISAQAATILAEKQEHHHSEAAIPVIGGVAQPLHGIYTSDIVSVIAEMLQKQTYAFHTLLDRINWTSINESYFLAKHVDPCFAANLNTPKEYEKTLQFINKANS